MNRDDILRIARETTTNQYTPWDDGGIVDMCSREYEESKPYSLEIERTLRLDIYTSFRFNSDSSKEEDRELMARKIWDYIYGDLYKDLSELKLFIEYKSRDEAKNKLKSLMDKHR